MEEAALRCQTVRRWWEILSVRAWVEMEEGAEFCLLLWNWKRPPPPWKREGEVRVLVLVDEDEEDEEGEKEEGRFAGRSRRRVAEEWSERGCATALRTSITRGEQQLDSTPLSLSLLSA